MPATSFMPSTVFVRWWRKAAASPMPPIHWRRISEAANEVESLPLEPGRTDVVRLMNLHKAKGLEANVVFLADPNGGLTLRVDNHIERKDLKAQGWFKLVQKSEANSLGRQASRRARRLARARSGGTAVSPG